MPVFYSMHIVFRCNCSFLSFQERLGQIGPEEFVQAFAKETVSSEVCHEDFHIYIRPDTCTTYPYYYICLLCKFQDKYNHMGDVMVSILTSNVVDCGCEPRLGQSKDNQIDICCFSIKYTVLRSKINHWLVQIRIMCLSAVTCLLFQ